MARYPVFGQLTSFGSYTFLDESTDLQEDPWTIATKPVAMVGKSYPVDGYGGGRAPIASTRCTWTYRIRAPIGTPLDQKAAFVEAEYEKIRALADGTATGGASTRTQTLTVQMIDGTTASAKAELESAPIRSADRHAILIIVNLVFLLHEPFT